VIVLVASTRPAKIDATRDALAAIGLVDSRFRDVTVEPRDASAIAPRMPMTLSEIIAGAESRASAVRTAAMCDFAAGLEGGLVQLPQGDWSLQSWAAVTDGAAWGYGGGPSLVLPTDIAASVVAGEELGDVIDRMAGASVRGTRGAWGVLTRDLIGRADAFRMAVIAAFAPFYNSGAWTGTSRHELGLDSRSH
jgi:inosine/xanthosine triphosphatase